MQVVPNNNLPVVGSTPILYLVQGDQQSVRLTYSLTGISIRCQKMKNKQVYVLSKNGRPLMPSKRFGKVRRLLKAGLAKVVQRNPFTIQLLYKTTEHTQALVMGIDPGGKDIGITVRQADGEILWAGHLETRTEQVTENIKERKQKRASRRRHRRLKRQRRAKKARTVFVEKQYEIAGTKEQLSCKLIKPKLIRFHNRRRSEGWLTPTARHLLESHQNFVKKVAEILPVTHVRLEYGKFDIRKLEDPEVAGVEYQRGPKQGYANTAEYVLCRDNHTCQLCKKSNTALQVHHVVWKKDGGADTPENLLTLCHKCHDRVHRCPKTAAQAQQIFAGLHKRYVHTTLLNSIMPAFHQWLLASFDSVDLTYGYQTKEKRHRLGIPKSHVVDAYLISYDADDKIPSVDFDGVVVYEYRQFRRHTRQIIHATRERNYKYKADRAADKAIVAQNRNKRTGQLSNSLADFAAKQGKSVLPQLRVLAGKKVIRSRFDKFRKGDLVQAGSAVYVVKGYGEMGRRIGFVGQPEYVLAKDCSLIVRNSGMVCL